MLDFIEIYENTLPVDICDKLINEFSRLDNLGYTLISLIFNNECFEWNSNLCNATQTRATIISGAPTASRDNI